MQPQFQMKVLLVEQMQPSSLRAGMTTDSNESGRGWGIGSLMCCWANLVLAATLCRDRRRIHLSSQA